MSEECEMVFEETINGLDLQIEVCNGFYTVTQWTCEENGSHIFTPDTKMELVPQYSRRIEKHISKATLSTVLLEKFAINNENVAKILSVITGGTNA